MKMIKEKRIERMSKRLRWLFILASGFVFFFSGGLFINSAIQNIEKQEYIQEVIDRPYTDYFHFTKIVPTKTIYERWEVIRFKSYRTVNEVDGVVHPIWWLDIYFCSINGKNYWRTKYESTRVQNFPKTGDVITTPRTPKFWPPKVLSGDVRNCDMQASIEVCPLEGVPCKKQELWSDNFTIK